MDRISIDDVVKATGGRLIRAGREKHITGVKHDSRQCGAGDMFVAVIGENRDGHAYIPQVAYAGCGTVLVSHTDGWQDDIGDRELNIIEVDDTVYAMGQLASWYLDRLDVIRIAVTGSVGKTTTRDMIYYALGEKYSCGRNIKNYNNAVGLPLSIFLLESDTEVAVLEMGMDKAGEIDRLAEIVKPNIAVITNIGVSHIENFGSREGIFRAKMEVAAHITSRDGRKGTLVFPYDGEFLTRENTRGDYRQIVIGEDGRSDYIISDVDDLGLDGIKFTVEHMERSSRVGIPVPGRHNAINATIAIAVGGLLRLSVEEVERGLAETQLTGSRLKYIKGDSVSVIDDTYNASPDSMKSALRVLEKSRCSGRRTAILGDMYELGEQSGKQHLEVGLFARSVAIDRLIAVGIDARNIAEGAKGGTADVMYFESKEELIENIGDIVSSGDMVLVKGSRGMKMEDIVERILKI